jgi:ligand-binding sensor domain-containing protein
MNEKIKLSFLILLLSFHYSCMEKKPMAKEAEKSEMLSPTKADSLKFTSGISAIFQDSKGNYWFGSLQEGVAVYNGATFSYFTKSMGLTDNQIHSIQEDKEGIIWFNTQNGVSSFDGIRITNHTDATSKTQQKNFKMSSDEPLPGQWMKQDDDLWFEAGVEEGVYRYDGQNLKYLAFPPHKVLTSNENLFAVTDISKGKNNLIWFATYAGIFGYNGRQFTIINGETLGFDRKNNALHIRSILEDSKGRLWIGNNGIGVLVKEGDSILNFSNKHHLIHSQLTNNREKSPPGTLEHIFTIEEDKKGNIWFGDRDAGLWKFDGKALQNFTKKDGLKSDFALSIYEDSNEQLWFGMADGSLYKYNGQTFEKQF